MVQVQRLGLAGIDARVSLTQSSAETTIWSDIEERLVVELSTDRFRRHWTRQFANGGGSAGLCAWLGDWGVRANEPMQSAVVSADPLAADLGLDAGKSEYLRLLRFDPWGHAGLGGDLVQLLGSDMAVVRPVMEDFSGHSCAVVELRDSVTGEVMQEFWLAADAGWLPIRQILWRGPGRVAVSREAVVQEVVEALPGLFLPRAAIVRYPEEPGGERGEVIFQLTAHAWDEAASVALGAGSVAAKLDEPIESLVGEGTFVRSLDDGSGWMVGRGAAEAPVLATAEWSSWRSGLSALALLPLLGIAIHWLARGGRNNGRMAGEKMDHSRTQ